jgi:hypothetical protein
MARKLTITVSDEVYRGLYEKIGPGKISRFLDRLARPYVIGSVLERAYARATAIEDLEALYKEAGQDAAAEAEAEEWIEAGFAETIENGETDAAR